MLVSGYRFFGRDKIGSIKLLSVAVALVLLIVSYLAYNMQVTGFSTGMPRIPAPETHFELLRQLAIAMIREVVFPVVTWDPRNWKHNIFVALQGAVFIAFIWPILKSLSVRRGHVCRQRHLTSFVFVSVGVVYLISIILMRWNSQFDAFSYRLIGPGMILVFLGMANFLLTMAVDRKGYIFGFLLVMSLLSVVAHTYSAVFGKSDLSYQQATLDRMERYESVPVGSIVLFADTHVNYLRPDLYVSTPRYRPYSSADEPWDEFLASLDKTRKIYVDMSGQTNIPDRYHQSVRDFLAHHRTGDLFELVRE